MKLIPLIALLFSMHLSLFANGPDTYTVMAQSGLNLRTQPDLKSPIITTLSFGEQVTAPFESQAENGWLKVTYKEWEGYVFFNYLLPGNTVVQADSINKDYRILTEGHHCHRVNYSPSLKWYGFYPQNDGSVLIKPVQIEIRIFKNYTHEDTMELESWHRYRIKVLTDLEDTSIFLLGVIKELPISSIVPAYMGSRWNDKWNRIPEGKFIYPFENFELGNSHLSADVDLPVDREQKQVTMNYKLQYTAYSREVKCRNGFPFSGEPRHNTVYKNPQLLLAADLNEDSVNDLLFLRVPITDTGAPSWTFYLFLTKQESQKQFSISLVSEMELENCITY